MTPNDSLHSPRSATNFSVDVASWQETVAEEAVFAVVVAVAAVVVVFAVVVAVAVGIVAEKLIQKTRWFLKGRGDKFY